MIYSYEIISLQMKLSYYSPSNRVCGIRGVHLQMAEETIGINNEKGFNVTPKKPFPLIASQHRSYPRELVTPRVLSK